MRTTRSISHGPAVDRHRIYIVEQQRIRGKLVHVITQSQQNRDRPQTAEHTAGSKRIAHTLLYAILLRNVDVQLIGIQSALLKRRNDETRISDGLTSIRRRLDARLESAPINERLHQFAAAFQPYRIDVHERHVPLLHRRVEQNIAPHIAPTPDDAPP